MGEFDLIARIRAATPRGDRATIGIGDDCAALKFTDGREVVVTTDMLMDGRHFRLEAVTPEEVGYKAMAVNLSDIAAMAANPIAAVVAVALPNDRASAIGPKIHAGLLPLAERFGVEIVGGDTNAWDGPLVLSVTLLGEATERGVVGRSGAEPGDVVIVTGPLGGSLRGRHLHPTPRIAEALAIHEAADLHAMIDLSDGLSSDLGHILEASGGWGATLVESAIPIHPDAEIASRSDGKRSPLGHALDDGEDFELCFTVAPDAADRLAKLVGPKFPLYRIGTITAEPGLRLLDHSGRIVPIDPGGFDHFRANRP